MCTVSRRLISEQKYENASNLFLLEEQVRALKNQEALVATSALAPISFVSSGFT